MPFDIYSVNDQKHCNFLASLVLLQLIVDGGRDGGREEERDREWERGGRERETDGWWEGGREGRREKV